jgi:type II secretory ATPase GspE/PulE/Tfp pilus assembly ATPase PilB-like protein
VAVSEKAGLTFAAGLRSILRQDPDIIMVGEIRDPETAKTRSAGCDACRSTGLRGRAGIFELLRVVPPPEDRPMPLVEPVLS